MCFQNTEVILHQFIGREKKFFAFFIQNLVIFSVAAIITIFLAKKK